MFFSEMPQIITVLAHRVLVFSIFSTKCNVANWVQQHYSSQNNPNMMPTTESEVGVPGFQNNSLEYQQQMMNAYNQQVMGMNNLGVATVGHEFKVKTFQNPRKCMHCTSVMLGVRRQGAIGV